MASNPGLTLHKKYELTLVVRDTNDEMKFRSRDTVVSDDLVHLLSQFMLVIVALQKRENEEDILRRQGYGDIPF